MNRAFEVALGLGLFLSGSWLFVCNTFAVSQVQETPRRVFVQDVENGLRPMGWWRGCLDAWWRVIDGVFLYEKAKLRSPEFSSTEYLFIPYASHPNASWEEVHFIVKFDLDDIVEEEIKSYGSPVGTVAAPGSGTLPEALTRQVPGLEDRVTILEAGDKPEDPSGFAILGTLLLLVGVTLLLRSLPENFRIGWRRAHDLRNSPPLRLAVGKLAKPYPQHRYPLTSRPYGLRPRQGGHDAQGPSDRKDEREEDASNRAAESRNIVRQWRGRKPGLGRPPWALARWLAQAAEDGTRRHLVAHFEASERLAALRHVLPLNPSLALAWADDLCAEHGVEAVEPFLSEVRCFARAGRRRLLGYRYLGVLFFGYIGSFFAGQFIRPLTGYEGESVTMALCSVTGALGLAFLLLRLFLSPSRDNIEALLVAPLNIRNEGLRQRLAEILADAVQSYFMAAEIERLVKEQADASLALETAPLEILKISSESRFVRLLAYIRNPLVAPILQQLVTYRRRTAADAVKTMAARLPRFPEEKSGILECARSVWTDSGADFRVRREACVLLVAVGERPGDQSSLRRQVAIYRGLIVGMMLLLSYPWYPFFSATNWSLQATTTTAAETPPPESSSEQDEPTDWGCTLSLILTALMLTDAFKRGVLVVALSRSIELPILLHALLNIYLFNFTTPFYVMNRKHMSELADEVDWLSFEKAVRGAEASLEALTDEVEDFTRRLESDNAYPYDADQLIRRESEMAQPILEFLLRFNNHFSLQALEVIRLRCRRFADEQKTAATVCRRILQNRAAPYRIRLAANRVQRIVHGPDHDRRLAIEGALLFLVSAGSGLFWWASIFFIPKAVLGGYLFLAAAILWVAAPFGVFADLKRILPEPRQHFLHNSSYLDWSPTFYIVSTVFSPFVFVPLYLSNRGLLRNHSLAADRSTAARWLESRRAARLYERDLAAARDNDDPREEAAVLGNLGLAHYEVGETRRAIELFERHLEIARQTSDRHGEALTSWNLGLITGEGGDLARAAELMQVLVDYELETEHFDAFQDAAQVVEVRAAASEAASETSS